MYYILLSGGSGKRLWPISSDIRPKQYVKLLRKENNSMENASMLQRVEEQLKEAGIWEKTVITAGRDQVELIKSQLKHPRVAEEPKRRDTFAAAVLSCAYLCDRLNARTEDYVTIMSVDLYTESAYFDTLKKLEKVMEENHPEVGLIGVTPMYPATKYGYILPGKEMDGYYLVDSFKEKPDRDTAVKLCSQNALWNCGVFCVKIEHLLSMAKEYVEDISYEYLWENYDALPKISFDYQVLEKAVKLAAVKFDGYWKDLGTWESMAEQMSTDTMGNVILDDSCTDTQVVNELKVPVVVTGTKNLIVAASREGILVADKDHTEQLKELTGKFLSKPMVEERRWGTLETLDETDDEGNITLTRKIKIYEGMSSSYHFHKNRDEIWTVLKGEGELILEGNKILLTPGKAVVIRKNQRHAIKAWKEFEYIEIHVGKEVGNDDIHRITFRWDEIELAGIL